MNTTTSPGATMYPLNRCKILHLVRHAEGIHNVEGANKSKTSPELLDACLSPLGWQQVQDLQKRVGSCGLLPRIQLVVVSPLLRTLQTADGVFGEGIQNGNHTDTSSAESSVNRPPFIAHELCRERMGVNTCDKRRSISEYKDQFPAVDFSLIESDEDMLWTPDTRETDQQLSARGLEFFKWLWTRNETEIAIVTHSAFLFQTLQAFGEDWHPSIKTELCSFFKNCELRSLVLVDQDFQVSPSNGTTASQPYSTATQLKQPTDTAKANGRHEYTDDKHLTDLSKYPK